jgi:hypothetical protein
MSRVGDAFQYRGAWQVLGLAVDERHLFWIETSRDRRQIVQMPKEGGTATVLFTFGPGSEADWIAEHGSELYVRTQRRQLGRIDKTTGRARFAELPDLGGMAAALVVDGPDAAWFPDSGCRRIWRWGHDDAEARAVTVAGDGWSPDAPRVGLAVEPGAVYCGAGGRLYRLSLADETVTVVVSTLKDVGAMLVVGDALFFVNDRLSAIATGTAGTLPWVDERLMSWGTTGAQEPVDLGPTGGLVRRLVAGPGQLCWATDPLGTGTTRVACRNQANATAEVDRRVTNGHIASDQQWLFWSTGDSIRRAPLP